MVTEQMVGRSIGISAMIITKQIDGRQVNKQFFRGQYITKNRRHHLTDCWQVNWYFFHGHRTDCWKVKRQFFHGQDITKRRCRSVEGRRDFEVPNLPKLSINRRQNSDISMFSFKHSLCSSFVPIPRVYLGTALLFIFLSKTDNPVRSDCAKVMYMLSQLFRILSSPALGTDN